MCKALKKIHMRCQLDRWVVKHLDSIFKSWQCFPCSARKQKHWTNSVVSNTLSCLGLTVQLIIVIFAYSCKTEVWMIVPWATLMMIDVVACWKMSYILKRWFIFVSCHIYYCGKGTTVATGTKAWVLQCTNLGIAWMHFVMIRVLVLQRYRRKREKEIPF